MKRPATAVVFLILIGLFIAVLTPRAIQIQSLKERSKNLEVEISKLQADNQKLETELRLLRDDPVYLEKVARQRFNMAKEGEIVYKVVRPEDEKK